MDLERRRTLVAQYREGPAVVEAALAGATGAELDARPADGGWTARETAHHIADSELTSAIRAAAVKTGSSRAHPKAAVNG